MKRSWFALALIALLLPWSATSQQDSVTIPKSRLQELEQKEKELEKLKQGQNDASPVTSSPASAASTNAVAQPVVRAQAPVLADLPPFKEGDTIDAVDLAGYFAQDPSGAERRFGKQKLQVRGEIAGFEKPMFRRNYRILLRTADRDNLVVCDFLPPDKYNAVLTVNHGSDLVALQGETRIPLAKVGQRILVQGACKGRAEKSVMITGSGFKAAN